MKSNGKRARSGLKGIILLLGGISILALSLLSFAPSAHAMSQSPLRTVDFNTLQVNDNCAHAKGTIIWGGGIVSVVGKFDQFDRCKGTSYLYLSYDSGGHHYNHQVGRSTGKTTNVDSQFEHFFNVAHIALTVCSTRGGWHCGKPLRV